MTRKPNILFVTLDCLRQDFTEKDSTKTPFIDSLREDGVEYTEMHSTTTTTTPSVASLFSGTYSETNGVNSLRNVNFSKETPSIAEVLQENGYTTAAMVTGPLLEETGLDRGFDYYWHRDKEDRLLGSWRETAEERVTDLEEPFFLYLHLWELHKPLQVPSEYDKPEYGENKYARILSAMDTTLNSFTDIFPENTVTAIHGDHGESMAWRESLFRKGLKKLRDKFRHEWGFDTRPVENLLNKSMLPFMPNYPDHFIEDGHGETIHDFMTNVPFILHGPGIEPGHSNAQCRQIDITPTLLDYLDIDTPDIMEGKTLLPSEKVEDRLAYIRACGATLKGEENWQRGIRLRNHKYVTFPNRDWSSELYNTATDENELYNLASKDPDKLDEFKDKLPSKELVGGDNLDIEEHLEDLGYM